MNDAVSARHNNADNVTDTNSASNVHEHVIKDCATKCTDSQHSHAADNAQACVADVSWMSEIDTSHVLEMADIDLSNISLDLGLNHTIDNNPGRSKNKWRQVNK